MARTYTSTVEKAAKSYAPEQEIKSRGLLLAPSCLDDIFRTTLQPRTAKEIGPSSLERRMWITLRAESSY
nr:hypothetical protein CFP56_52798 [Quercus suber]